MTTWDLRSGLTDEYDGTVLGGRFGTREVYGAAAGARPGEAPLMLMLTIQSDEFEKPIEEAWSIGADWQLKDEDDQEVVHVKNADFKAFTRNSKAGRLIASMCKAAGEGNIEKGKKFMSSRGEMTQIKPYTGLMFHFKRHEDRTPERLGGKETTIVLAEAFLGEAPPTEASTPAARPARKAATTATRTAPAPAKASAFVVGDELLEQIHALVLNKTEQQAKTVLFKELKSELAPEVYSPLMNEIYQRNLLKTLVDEGKLEQDPDGVFI